MCIRDRDTLVPADIHLADGIRGVGTVAVRKRVLAAHDLTTAQVTAGFLDVIQREDIGVRNGGHVIPALAAVAGVMLAVQEMCIRDRLIPLLNRLRRMHAGASDEPIDNCDLPYYMAASDVIFLSLIHILFLTVQSFSSSTPGQVSVV